MNLKNILDTRYSTKEFDATRKISDSDFEQIKYLLRMSPSSTNLQPWHFIIASTDAGKQRIIKGTEAFAFNTNKVLGSSHVILFCSRLDADETYLQQVLEQEDKDGRFTEAQFKEGMHKGRKHFVNIHKHDLRDLPHWMDKQVYLNMGTLLLGVATLGIDAVPMEGVDVKALNEEFGLPEKGYTALALVALGYHKDSDFNAKLPKSRLPESVIIDELP